MIMFHVNLQGCTPTTTDIAANGRPSQKEKGLNFLNTVSGDMDIKKFVFAWHCFRWYGFRYTHGLMALVEEEILCRKNTSWCFQPLWKNMLVKKRIFETTTQNIIDLCKCLSTEVNSSQHYIPDPEFFSDDHLRAGFQKGGVRKNILREFQPDFSRIQDLVNSFSLRWICYQQSEMCRDIRRPRRFRGSVPKKWVRYGFIFRSFHGRVSSSFQKAKLGSSCGVCF